MKAGQEFILTARDVEGTDKIASVSYKDLPQEVKAGDHIVAGKTLYGCTFFCPTALSTWKYNPL